MRPSVQSPPAQKKSPAAKSRVPTRSSSLRNVIAARTMRDELSEEPMRGHVSEMEPAFEAMFNVAAHGSVAAYLKAQVDAVEEKRRAGQSASRASSFRGRSSTALVTAAASQPKCAITQFFLCTAVRCFSCPSCAQPVASTFVGYCRESKYVPSVGLHYRRQLSNAEIENCKYSEHILLKAARLIE
jgi:hypothetical protein